MLEGIPFPSELLESYPILPESPANSGVGARAGARGKARREPPLPAMACSRSPRHFPLSPGAPPAAPAAPGDEFSHLEAVPSLRNARCRPAHQPFDGPGGRCPEPARPAAEDDRLTQEIHLLREELRIKDARVAKIDPRRRPYYPPTERMAILELKAARGWSLARAARIFLIDTQTITAWLNSPSPGTRPRNTCRSSR